MPLTENIDCLFSPRSIVLIGSPEREDSMASLILGNLLKAGYTGNIFPVNFKANSILGLPVLCKPRDIPGEHLPPDLAVVCLPLDECPQALRECAGLAVKAALFIGPAYRQPLPRDAGIERELKEIAEANGIAILGPNSLGIMSASIGLNLTPEQNPTPTGHTAFFSQSNAFGLAMLSWAKEKGLAFSRFACLGSRSFLNECDMLSWLAEDAQTKVITGYLKTVENGSRFLRNAGRAAMKKPIILCRPGHSPDGTRVTSSHNGALSGSDLAFDAACRKSGIIRAKDMQELFAMAYAFSLQPLPAGPGLAFITNTGAPGIFAADACAANGLTLAGLSPGSIETLKANLPPHANLYNPIDVTESASPRDIAFAAETALRDAAVHAVIATVCPVPGMDMQELAEKLVALPNPYGKPLLACLMGGRDLAPAKELLSRSSIPCYAFPEEAVRVLGAMYRRSQWAEQPLPVEIGYRNDKSRAAVVIDEARERGVLELSDYYSLQILSAYEVPCMEARLARTSDEAIQIAKQIRGPVALKIASPHIAHKTDAAGVALNVSGKEQIKAAFLDITGRARRIFKDAYIAGCLVQSMAREGSREAVIGFRRDRVFGPMVFFGLGGIHMQTFRDVSCRLAPLSLEDACAMVREIRAFPVLAGMQGNAPVKFTAIEDILLIMSQLALDFPDIQEVECNPVFVDELGAQIADMRALLVRGRSAQERRTGGSRHGGFPASREIQP